MAYYFNVVPRDVHLEIRELDVKVGEERKLLSHLKLLEYLCGWVLDLGHTRGRKRQFMN